MIDTAFVEQRMRDVNPVSGFDDIKAEELSRAVAATHTRRAAVMQAPTQPQTTLLPPTTPPRLRRRRAWAFAAAFIVILASIGIATIALRNNNPPVTDEPAPPTTVAENLEEPIGVESLTWSRVPLDQALFSDLGSDSWYQLEVSDIVAGGPGLVAVGGEGPGGYASYATVWTSPDGYTWSRVAYDEATFGTDLKIKAVTVGGPGLVAVGDQDVWTSPDGYEWSRVTLNPTVVHPITGDLRGVIAGGPGLVAFGESAGTSAVWTSPDGYTWTQVPHDEAVFGRSSIHSVTQGGPGLVAVGVDETEWDEPHKTFAVVWTSLDGYTWTRVSHDPSVFSEGTGMVDVAVGGPGLVAVGCEQTDESIVAAVWTSPDGFSWTRVPHDEAIFGGLYEDMSSVAAVGDGFVAVGSWPWTNVWTSPDGITWTRIPHDDAVFGENTSMFKVIAGGPGIVVLGSAPEGPAMWVGTPTDADERVPEAPTDKGGTP